MTVFLFYSLFVQTQKLKGFRNIYGNILQGI